MVPDVWEALIESQYSGHSDDKGGHVAGLVSEAQAQSHRASLTTSRILLSPETSGKPFFGKPIQSAMLAFCKDHVSCNLENGWEESKSRGWAPTRRKGICSTSRSNAGCLAQSKQGGEALGIQRHGETG